MTSEQWKDAISAALTAAEIARREHLAQAHLNGLRQLTSDEWAAEMLLLLAALREAETVSQQRFDALRLVDEKLGEAEKREQRLATAMREHWLMRIECDHEAKRDNPICACSAVFLGWHDSVGAAVEAWAQHVEDAALSGPEEGQE